MRIITRRSLLGTAGAGAGAAGFGLVMTSRPVMAAAQQHKIALSNS